MNRSQPHVRASWLGSVPYREAWDLQAALVRELQEGRDQDTLLLLEHPHVFTLGKAAAAEHVLWDEDERARRKVELVWSDRGGEATYHGPGQLVGYPVLDLVHMEISIPRYLELLEGSLIDYLAELGIDSEPGERGFTGVWRNGEKLAAIGIKLNRPVVSHGFALNLTTDLAYFDGIVPCGHVERRPTSVEAVTGVRVPAERAAADYARHFARRFNSAVDWIPSQEILRIPSGAAQPE
ncbi:MAG TPA: lipoyl(octanoyl) transferase LipB [Candidatus Dormibacteraeota bacterium]|nr:lipoyl(octanoyl) transferase LipB [Candidatus Dormibacteraeota bacterium]